MALKNYKPTSPARRGLILVDKSAPVEGQAGQGAYRRQAQGPAAATTRVTSPRAGDRRWSQAEVPLHRLQASASGICRPTVERLEYDPNRTAFIALVKVRGR